MTAHFFNCVDPEMIRQDWSMTMLAEQRYAFVSSDDQLSPLTMFPFFQQPYMIVLPHDLNDKEKKQIIHWIELIWKKPYDHVFYVVSLSDPTVDSNASFVFAQWLIVRPKCTWVIGSHLRHHFIDDNQKDVISINQQIISYFEKVNDALSEQFQKAKDKWT